MRRLALILTAVLAASPAWAVTYSWVQVAAPGTVTATSDARVHAVADAANGREWIMFRQASVSAGTGKLWRRTASGVEQLSGGPSGWTYYYAVNYDATLGQICVTSERKVATSSPSGTPSWSESDIGGGAAKHFTDKPLKKFSASSWVMARSGHQTSSTNVAFHVPAGTEFSSYNPTSQAFLANQVASALTSSSVIALLAMYTDTGVILSSLNSADARPFASQSNNSTITSPSLILPGFNFAGASKAVFTISNGTSTDAITVNASGAATVINFNALLVRPGIEADLTGVGSNRAYLIRSDGRLYESNSSGTTFSLVSTATIPQVTVGAGTALHMYLSYSGRPAVILSDGSIVELQPAVTARPGRPSSLGSWLRSTLRGRL